MQAKQKAKSELKYHFKLFAGYPAEQRGEALTKMLSLLAIIEAKAPEFVKKVFRKATSLNELKKSVEGALFEGFAVSKNAKLDVCNQGVESIVNVMNRFKISKPMTFFGNMAQSPFRGSKIPKNTNAMYFRIRSFFGTQEDKDGIIFPVGVSLEKTAQQKERANDMYDAMKEAHVNKALENPIVCDAVKVKLKELKKWRWSVSESFEGTINHEMGHLIHSRNHIQGIDIVIREAYQLGWPVLISKYAMTNSAEFFAETFTAYMEGEHDIIEPRLLKMLKDMDELPDDE